VTASPGNEARLTSKHPHKLGSIIHRGTNSPVQKQIGAVLIVAHKKRKVRLPLYKHEERNGLDLYKFDKAYKERDALVGGLKAPGQPSISVS